MHPSACANFSQLRVDPGMAPIVRRAQTLAAMVLQKMANGKRFSEDSNAYMVPMNGFIDENVHRLTSLFQMLQQRAVQVTPGAAAPLDNREAAQVCGDLEIEVLASCLHDLHTAIYAAGAGDGGTADDFSIDVDRFQGGLGGAP